MKKTLLLIIPMIVFASSDSIEDKINSLENELKLLKEQVKMNYTTSKIAGENTKIYNNADASLNGLQRRDEYTKNFNAAASIRFRLNMAYQVDKSVNFRGWHFTEPASKDATQSVSYLSIDAKF